MSLDLETLDALILETVQAATRIAVAHPYDWSLIRGESTVGIRLHTLREVRSRILLAEIRALESDTLTP